METSRRQAGKDVQQDDVLGFFCIWICPITVNGAIILVKLNNDAQGNALTVQDYRAITGLLLKPAGKTLHTQVTCFMLWKMCCKCTLECKMLKSVFYTEKGTSGRVTVSYYCTCVRNAV